MRGKMSDSRGFSLVEMLCATVILVLLGLLVNTGLQLAMRSYQDLTAQSEAELLLSAVSNALADDLRYARDVQTDGSPENKLTSYQSQRYNDDTRRTKLWVPDEDSDDGILGQLYANNYRVLPGGAYGNGAYEIDKLEIIYKDGLFTIDLTVKQTEGDISAGTQFTVRCLNK